MKDFLITNYKFNKGAIGSGYIEIFEDDFRIDRLISVINQTKGIVLYATGSPTLKFNSVVEKKVYFGVDTSTMANNDVLQVVYNSSNPLPVLAEDTDENLILLRQITRILFPLNNNFQTNGLNVSVNGWSSSIGAISVAISSGNVGVTSMSSFLGITYDSYFLNEFGNLSRIAFNGLRNNITY